MSRLAVPLAAILTILAGALAAQAPAAPRPGTQQVFKTGVEVTAIDVTVVDRDGTPVGDLKASGFAVTVDGRRRTIVSAQFVSLATPTTAAAPPPRRDYTANNFQTPGRLIALAIDQSNIRPGNEKSVLRAAEGFLDRLTPADRVAVFTFPPPGPSLAFTGDVLRVKDALRGIHGGYEATAGLHHIAATEALAIEDGDADALRIVVERECGVRADENCTDQIVYESRAIAPQVRRRAGDTVRTLSDIFTFLGQIDGPKTLVWIAEGLVLDAARFPQGLPVEVERLAARSRARIYVLRIAQNAFDASEPRPVQAVDQPAQTVGLETIAGVTGGEMLTVVGTGGSIFDRVSRETAGIYLLGIETTEQDRDGKRHRVRVSVGRGRVQVRARRELEADAGSAPAAERPADRSPSDDILAALRAPLLSTALPMRVSSYVLQDRDPAKVRLMLAADLGEGLAQPARMGLGYELRDPLGNAIVRHAGPATLHPDASGHLEYREEFSVAPGDYTFKLAAADAAGHIGTIDRAVHAVLARIGVIDAADLVLNDEADLERGTPTPVEATIASGRLSCALDLRTRAGAMPARAQIAFEVLDGSGRKALTAPGQIVSAADGVRHVVRAIVDTSALAPGEYVVHAIFTVAGQRAGDVTRGFRVRM
jgi:VWFA-related protein